MPPLVFGFGADGDRTMLSDASENGNAASIYSRISLLRLIFSEALESSSLCSTIGTGKEIFGSEFLPNTYKLSN